MAPFAVIGRIALTMWTNHFICEKLYLLQKL